MAAQRSRREEPGPTALERPLVLERYRPFFVSKEGGG